MKIKKTSGTAILKGNVVDNLTDNSTDNAPSQRAVNEKFTQIKQDVLLYGEISSGYNQTVILNDNALKFRELIFVTTQKDSNTTYKAITIPIIDGEILSGGTTHSYHWLDLSIISYSEDTKELKFTCALWTNSSNNSSIGFTKIIGRY